MLDLSAYTISDIQTAKSILLLAKDNGINLLELIDELSNNIGKSNMEFARVVPQKPSFDGVVICKSCSRKEKMKHVYREEIWYWVCPSCRYSYMG